MSRWLSLYLFLLKRYQCLIEHLLSTGEIGHNRSNNDPAAGKGLCSPYVWKPQWVDWGLTGVWSGYVWIKRQVGFWWILAPNLSHFVLTARIFLTRTLGTGLVPVLESCFLDSLMVEPTQQCPKRSTNLEAWGRGGCTPVTGGFWWNLRAVNGRNRHRSMALVPDQWGLFHV